MAIPRAASRERDMMIPGFCQYGCAGGKAGKEADDEHDNTRDVTTWKVHSNGMTLSASS